MSFIQVIWKVSFEKFRFLWRKLKLCTTVVIVLPPSLFIDRSVYVGPVGLRRKLSRAFYYHDMTISRDNIFHLSVTEANGFSQIIGVLENLAVPKQNQSFSRHVTVKLVRGPSSSLKFDM